MISCTQRLAHLLQVDGDGIARGQVIEDADDRVGEVDVGAGGDDAFGGILALADLQVDRRETPGRDGDEFKGRRAAPRHIWGVLDIN